MAETTTFAYIGLGANLGDARATLAAAVAALATLPACRLEASSPVYRSAPMASSGPDYLNAVAALATSLAPHDLLHALQGIEQQHGRERPYRNAPRTLDLDLLLFGNQVIDSPDLVVPHPRLHQRAFVLRPLADLAPLLVIPGRGSLASLLEGVADQQADRLLS
jgi:2-amino-4-hydroxy-6-hydroxymethyldihydropteridine diphosphokinase